MRWLMLGLRDLGIAGIGNAGMLELGILVNAGKLELLVYAGMLELRDLGIAGMTGMLESWNAGMLELRESWNSGLKAINVDPKYTSQRCHICGDFSKENWPNQSLFLCSYCNYIGNADINAAKNIYNLSVYKWVDCDCDRS